MPDFIAIDGEADNRGRYIVLCDSQGRVLYNPDGITTSEALQFLLSLPTRGHEIVCYGLNYDVNQWIRNLNRGALEALAHNNHCVWQAEYKLEWIPTKMFTVTVPGKTVTVAEVFGFFQTSFVKALQQWGMTPPAEIERMKQRRGTFTRKQIQQVIHYCQHECRLLVQLMDKLDAACADAECTPRGRWIGAGSIASALLRRHDVVKHHRHDVDLFGEELTQEYVLRAYFGGRVELYQQGWNDYVTAADIISAYPYAAQTLPSLHGAIAVPATTYQAWPYAMWRVSWNHRLSYAHPNTVGPFPVRLPQGQICYPLTGSGVYHAAEVHTAMRMGYDVTIHDGVLVRPAIGAQPLFWINDVYEHRAKLKREGNFAEKALKLGLNSIYGKMAQGYGYGRKPPFQSYYWAGYITSLTRARVLETLCKSVNPIMVATDGVVAREAHTQSPAVAQLGGWEVTGYERLATIQPGVYLAETDGERLVKSRGFFARDVDYDQLLDDFYRDSLGCYHYDSRRFIGLKVALHRKDFSIWRQWVNERRTVAFEVNNKERIEQPDGRVQLMPLAGPFDSLPYEPKQSLYDDPTDSKLENIVRDDQPHREVD